MQIRNLPPDDLMAGLKKTFEAFNRWNGGVDRSAMDKVRWGKALRDSQLIRETGGLPVRKANAVYDKVLPASSRALNFPQFLEALRHVAVALRASLNEVIEALVAVGRPEGP